MRLAILGCGSIGSRHARNAVALGACEVRLFDTDAARARALATELALTAAPTLTDLWAWQPAAAIIATPSFQHVPLAREAARHGCDLFVEKPLGHSRDGVEDLIAQAAGRRLVTLVGCNMRFHPGPAAVKRLVEEGAIGSVLSARLQTGSYLPDWRPGQDYRTGYSAHIAQGGGAILDCIHEIDLALWYFGPARLTASVVRPATSIGLDVDGLAELLLEHESGVVSSVHLNFIQRDYRRGCEVVGTTGTIYWDFTAPCVALADGKGRRTVDLPRDWPANQMYVDELSHFLECVSTRRQSAAPLEAGKAALDIALAARAHSPSGRGVTA